MDHVVKHAVWQQRRRLRLVLYVIPTRTRRSGSSAGHKMLSSYLSYFQQNYHGYTYLTCFAHGLTLRFYATLHKHSALAVYTNYFTFVKCSCSPLDFTTL